MDLNSFNGNFDDIKQNNDLPPMNYTYNNGKNSCTFSDEDKLLNDTV